MNLCSFVNLSGLGGVAQALKIQFPCGEGANLSDGRQGYEGKYSFLPVFSNFEMQGYKQINI
ncbi:MAG: hypothetical protein EPN39_16260 [Chitinophagaceae bacterium]|nr:MAG: hypothetical protein EPN39_16260 [Chitinophagaceae bacterium]